MIQSESGYDDRPRIPGSQSAMAHGDEKEVWIQGAAEMDPRFGQQRDCADAAGYRVAFVAPVEIPPSTRSVWPVT